MSGSVNKNLNDYGGEPPVGDVPSNSKDDTYASRPGQSSQVPVQKDDDPVKIADEDNAGIDRGNVMGNKTRGATKKAGTYQEPGDEEGLPVNDGTSAISK